jgi:two-component system, sensor histidine kinase LadS
VTRTLGRIRVPWLALVSLALFSCTAGATNHIVEQAWYEDPTGSMTLDEVKRQPVQRFAGSLARGYGEHPVWVRLRIDPDVGTREDATLRPNILILRIKPPFQMEVQLHDPLTPGRVATTGLATERKTELFASPALSLAIARGEQPRELWLRMSSHHTRYASFEVVPLGEAVERGQREQVIASVFVGVVLLTIAWAVQAFFFLRDRVMLFFLVKQVGALAYALAQLGYMPMLLVGIATPATTDLLFDLSIIFNTALGTALCYVLLIEYRPPRWGMRLLLACALLPLIGLTLLASGRQLLLLQINAAVSLLAPALIFLLALLSRPAAGDSSPVVPIHALTAVFGTVFAGIAILSAGGLGLHAVGGIAFLGGLLVNMLLGVLLVFFLQARMNRTIVRQKQAVIDLGNAQRQVEQERWFREDREKLLAMLGHEIKTPLSTLRMSVGGRQDVAPAARRAIADIDAIVERCTQLGLVEGAGIEPNWTRCELGEVLAQGTVAEPHQPRIDWSAAETFPLTTDRQVLEIIVRNLLENACKYSPKHSAVQVGSRRVEREGRPGVEISVASEPGDVGWPDPEQLFRKYYRAPQARRVTGSGLGLYLIAALARALGGSVGYAPTSTHVRFVVWLPMTTTADVA